MSHHDRDIQRLLASPQLDRRTKEVVRLLHTDLLLWRWLDRVRRAKAENKK